MERAALDQTLIETDCPVFYKNKLSGDGFQAEPKDVFRTLQAYCELRNFEEEKTLEVLNQNARTFFNFRE